ncbi:hypothetical protein [Brasilonema bromeliae]|uniref:NERD domain-containing protein n=1 Tax=Brasilonema bromeliae SPC951 TaxID=385972 RepID=A0ABX1P2Z9_9CYAN|nr:hypothetical protein [Brasilonema bromeliae]NMG18458.1 hypothetical protein [Brasilonema bromeliae SPC951]
MIADEVNNFVTHCKRIQPQSQEEIKKFFEGVVSFPYDNELLLQAYLFLNIERIFPFCSELLLFEKSPIADYTDLGKCDFVYLSSFGNIFLIETKFIDTEATGATERKRRNKHRNKVFEQVITLKSRFSEYWNIKLDQLECAVFTTDSEVAWRGTGVNVVTKSISMDKLKYWRRNYKTEVTSHKSEFRIQNELGGCK